MHDMHSPGESRRLTEIHLDMQLQKCHAMGGRVAYVSERLAVWMTTQVLPNMVDEKATSRYRNLRWPTTLQYSKPRAVMVPSLPSLAGPYVVTMTICCAARNGKINIMTIVGLQLTRVSIIKLISVTSTLHINIDPKYQIKKIQTIWNGQKLPQSMIALLQQHDAISFRPYVVEMR